jgi:hypothetical protein
MLQNHKDNSIDWRQLEVDFHTIIDAGAIKKQPNEIGYDCLIFQCKWRQKTK